MKIFIQTFSKILGFLLALLLFIVILSIALSFMNNKDNKSYFSYLKGDKKTNNKIAILNISGPIVSEPLNFYNFEIINSLEAIYPSKIEEYLIDLEKQKILGLIISINSPGGSVSASHQIYNLINDFKQKNSIPIYFHSTDILASGGYWVALSGDKIFASYGTLIGSIGVKGPDWLYYNSPTSLSSGLLGSSVESPNGLKLFSNTAGISKDIFNPFREPLDKEMIELQEMVTDIYNDFINLVSSNRKIEKTIIKNEIGAMIFNTKKAKQHFLIDAQKNIDDIINILSKELKLDLKKIIINKKNTKYNILGLNLLLQTYNKKILNKYEIMIKDKFCNNLFNEFSAVAINSQHSKC